MSNKIDIISKALNLLGRNSINNLHNGDLVVVSASQFYDEIVEDELSSSIPWRFSMNHRLLAQDTVAPTHPKWQHSFQLPSDYLGIYELYPAYSSYDIFNDKIYSNETSVSIDYQHLVSENSFPPYFRFYLIYRLAASLAMLVTQEENIFLIWDKKATRKLVTSRAADSRMTRSKALKAGAVELAHLGSSNFGRLPDGFDV